VHPHPVGAGLRPGLATRGLDLRTEHLDDAVVAKDALRRASRVGERVSRVHRQVGQHRSVIART
jgi:hypothetical protein